MPTNSCVCGFAQADSRASLASTWSWRDLRATLENQAAAQGESVLPRGASSDCDLRTCGCRPMPRTSMPNRTKHVMMGNPVSGFKQRFADENRGLNNYRGFL